MVREKRTCETCKGLGWVLAWTRGRNGKAISYQKECGDCDGEGEK